MVQAENKDLLTVKPELCALGNLILKDTRIVISRADVGFRTYRTFRDRGDEATFAIKSMDDNEFRSLTLVKVMLWMPNCVSRRKQNQCQ